MHVKVQNPVGICLSGRVLARTHKVLGSTLHCKKEKGKKKIGTKPK